MRRALAAALLASLLTAAAALAARVDLGQVLNLTQSYWSALLVVGATGEGSVTIDGGTQVEEDSVALGGLPSANGTLSVTGSGSKLTCTGDPVTRASALTVGFQGEGHLMIAEGGVVDVDGSASQAGDLGASFALAVEAGSAATGTVSGAGSQLLVRNGAASGAGVAVGLAGDASLLVSDGALVQVDTGSGENSGLTVGNDPGASGILTVTGDDSLVELLGDGRGLTVGNAGNGELILEQGGLLTGAQVAFLGLQESGFGTIRIGMLGELRVEGTNPLLGFGGSLSVGLAGVGRLLVEGGSVVIDNQDGIGHGLQVGGATGCGGSCPLIGGSGSVVLDAGASLEILGPFGGASIGADGRAGLRVAGGSLFEVADEVSGGISAGISPGSSGEIVVTGAGSRIDAGSGLLLGVDLALADAGEARLDVADGGVVDGAFVTIGSDATLAGDGTLIGSVASRGTVAPGTSVSTISRPETSLGTLTVEGDLTQAGGAVRFEIAGTESGEADRLVASGALQLPRGAVHVDLVDGFLPEVGDEVLLATGDPISLDTAAAPSLSGAAPGFEFEVVLAAPGVVLRALTAAEGFGACQVAQLKAFSKLCKKLFDCEAAYAKKAAQDPGATKRDACLAAGEERFAKAYDKAAAKAASRGDVCGLTAPAAEVAAEIMVPAGILAGVTLFSDWEPGTNRDGDALRSALIKETGRLCGALLGASSKHAKQRDEAKRDAARATARQRFDTKTAKAFTQAGPAGAAYEGPETDQLAAETLALSRDATSRSAGVTP